MKKSAASLEGVIEDQSDAWADAVTPIGDAMADIIDAFSPIIDIIGDFFEAHPTFALIAAAVFLLTKSFFGLLGPLIQVVAILLLIAGGLQVYQREQLEATQRLFEFGLQAGITTKQMSELIRKFGITSLDDFNKALTHGRIQAGDLAGTFAKVTDAGDTLTVTMDSGAEGADAYTAALRDNKNIAEDVKIASMKAVGPVRLGAIAMTTLGNLIKSGPNIAYQLFNEVTGQAIPKLKGVTKAAEQAAPIMGALEKTTKGVAQASEEIAKPIIGATAEVEGLSVAIQNNAQTIGESATSLDLVAGRAKTAADNFIPLTDVLKSGTITAEAFSGQIETLSVNGKEVARAMAGVTGGISDAVSESQIMARGGKGLVDVQKSIAKAGGEMEKPIADAGKGWSTLSTTFTRTVDPIESVTAGLTPLMQEADQFVVTTMKAGKEADDMAKGIGGTVKSIDNLSKVVAPATANLEAMQEQATATGDSTTAGGKGVAKGGSKIKKTLNTFRKIAGSALMMAGSFLLLGPILEALEPIITAISDAIMDFLEMSGILDLIDIIADWIDENPVLAGGIFLALGALLLFGGALAPLLPAIIGLLGPVLSFVGGLFGIGSGGGAAAGALAAIAVPLAIIAAIIAAVVLATLAWENNWFGVRDAGIGAMTALRNAGLGPIAEFLEFLGRQVLIVGNIFLGVWDLVTGNWESAGRRFGNVADMVLDQFSFLTGGFLIGTDKMRKIWEGVWNGLVSFVKDPIGSLRNLGKGLREALIAQFELIKTGLTAIWEFLWKTVTDFLNNPFEFIRNIVNELFKALGAIFEVGLSVLNSIWQGGWDILKNAVSFVLDLIGNIIKGFLSFIEGLFGLKAGTLTDIWDKMWGGLKDSVMGGLDAIKSFFEAGFNAIIGFFKGISQTIQDSVNGILTFFSNAWETLKGIFQTAWELLKQYVIDPVVAIGKAIFDTFKPIVDFLVSVFKDPIETIKNLFFGLVDFFKGLGLWDALKGIINAILGGINFLIDQLHAGLQAIPNIFINGINALIDAYNAIPLIPDIGRIGSVTLPAFPHLPLLETGGAIAQAGAALLHPGELVVPASIVEGGGTFTPLGGSAVNVSPAGGGVGELTVNFTIQSPTIDSQLDINNIKDQITEHIRDTVKDIFRRGGV